MSDTHKDDKEHESDPNIGGQACCILEICCGGQEQLDALAALIDSKTSLSRAQSVEVAAVMVNRFDFAPVGTLKEFKRIIVANARKYKPNPGY
jgi:hypothetical protein